MAKKTYLINGLRVPATVIGGRFTPRSKNSDGRVTLNLGFQSFELTQLLMEQWSLDNRSEAIRRILLPLCAPIKEAIQRGEKEVVVTVTYHLDPKHYNSMTMR